MSELKKIWSENNKEHLCQYRKMYRNDNKEYLDKNSKLYHEKNKNKYAELKKKWNENNREHIAQYLEENKEKFTKYREIYNNENRQSLNRKSLLYAKLNRDKCNILTQKYRAKKKKLPCTLTLIQWETIKSQFDNKCAYCGKEKPLEKEHFISLNKNGEFTINNIICACRSCNSSKGNRDFSKWYPTYRNYSKKRETKILKFLGYENENQQLKIN